MIAVFFVAPAAARKDSRSRKGDTVADKKPAEGEIEEVGYSSADLMAGLPQQVFDGESIVTREAEAEPGPEETPPETPPAGDEPPEPPKPPEKKYKSWEEAEEGAREHQRFATEKAEEAKRDREALEAAERERDDLKQKLEAAPPKPVAPAKSAEELEAEQEGRIEAALDEINELDEFDPEYKKKVARSWRKAGLGGAGQPAMPDPKALDEIIDRRVEEKLKTREAKPGPSTLEQAFDLAAKVGLDMADPDSVDSVQFEHMRKRLPEEYDTKPLQEQVDWVVAEVRKRTGKVVQMTDAEREKALKTQKANAVLEKGNNRPPAPKKPDDSEPYTSAGILREVQEERRIRG